MNRIRYSTSWFASYIKLRYGKQNKTFTFDIMEWDVDDLGKIINKEISQNEILNCLTDAFIVTSVSKYKRFQDNLHKTVHFVF